MGHLRFAHDSSRWAAIANAADRVLKKAKTIAAHMLEASEEDIDFADGSFNVKGVPDHSVSFADVTLQAYLAWDLPEGIEPALEEQAFLDRKSTRLNSSHVSIS